MPCPDCQDAQITNCQCSLVDSETIDFSGAGSPDSPFTGDVIVTPDGGVLATPTGLELDYAVLTHMLGGLVGNIEDNWDTTSAVYVDWGGAGDPTAKSFTKVGSAAETDIVVHYAVTGYRPGGDGTGATVVATGAEIDGTTVNGSKWVLIGDTDLDANPREQHSSFGARGGVPAGVFTVRLRAKILGASGTVAVSDNSSFDYLVWEVPAGISFN